MSQLRQHFSRKGSRLVLIGAAVGLALGAATLTGMHYREGGATLISAPATEVLGGAVTRHAETAPARDPAPAAKQPDDTPAFDVVRVSPQGNAVIAGTAAPDQTVIIRDGSKEIGHTTADATGQWVLTPDQPLDPGARELTLAARTPQGSETAGQRSVLLVVPNRNTADRGTRDPPQTALAVLTPKAGTDEAPRVLQAPASLGAVVSGGGKNSRLDLDVLDYDDHGAMSFAGHAAPGAHVRIYIDNKPVSDAIANPQSRWVEKPGTIAPGQHQVRVDQLDPHGRVISRVELPFMRETAPIKPVAAGQVVVQPGATLWRLARQAYGQGMRYTVIYAYNSGVIRDPDRIYPGQIFTVPDAATAAASPAPVTAAK